MRRILTALVVSCGCAQQGPTGPAGEVGPIGLPGATGLNYKQIVTVSPGDTAVESGAALLGAVSGIVGATEERPILVKLEPGVYDLGASTLVTKPNVHLQGSGMTLTEITSIAGGQGTLLLSSLVTLRDLAITNHLAVGAPAVTAPQIDYTEIHSVLIANFPAQLDVASTSAALSISTSNLGSAEIRDSSIFADATGAGGGTTGVVVGTQCLGGTLDFKNTFVGAFGGATAQAMVVSGGLTRGYVVLINALDAPTGRGAVISGAGRLSLVSSDLLTIADVARGVLVQAGSLEVQHSEVEARAGGTDLVGIETLQGGTATVYSSLLKGNVGARNSGTSPTAIRIAGSTIRGGVQGTVTCTNSNSDQFVSAGANVCP